MTWPGCRRGGQGRDWRGRHGGTEVRIAQIVLSRGEKKTCALLPIIFTEEVITVARRVYVSNLSYRTTWQELKDHFRQVGSGKIFGGRRKTKRERERPPWGGGAQAPRAGSVQPLTLERREHVHGRHLFHFSLSLFPPLLFSSFSRPLQRHVPGRPVQGVRHRRV